MEMEISPLDGPCCKSFTSDALGLLHMNPVTGLPLLVVQILSLFILETSAKFPARLQFIYEIFSSVTEMNKA